MKLYTEILGSCRTCPNRIPMKDCYKPSWDNDYYNRFVCSFGDIPHKEIPIVIGQERYADFPDWCPLEDTK
jgi:hypothetical protein